MPSSTPPPSEHAREAPPSSPTWNQRYCSPPSDFEPDDIWGTVVNDASEANAEDSFFWPTTPGLVPRDLPDVPLSPSLTDVLSSPSSYKENNNGFEQDMDVDPALENENEMLIMPEPPNLPSPPVHDCGDESTPGADETRGGASIRLTAQPEDPSGLPDASSSEVDPSQMDLDIAFEVGDSNGMEVSTSLTEPALSVPSRAPSPDREGASAPPRELIDSASALCDANSAPSVFPSNTGASTADGPNEPAKSGPRPMRWLDRVRRFMTRH
ncbi:hypothetical protein EIP86_003048, partial [Pleurotus ostreatoroseus]